jgi:hypothetical protein
MLLLDLGDAAVSEDSDKYDVANEDGDYEYVGKHF